MISEQAIYTIDVMWPQNIRNNLVRFSGHLFFFIQLRETSFYAKEQRKSARTNEQMHTQCVLHTKNITLLRQQLKWHKIIGMKFIM